MQLEPRRVSGPEGKRNRLVGKVKDQVKGERPARVEAEEGQGGEEKAKEGVHAGQEGRGRGSGAQA